MKPLFFGVLFFASIHFGWATELELIPLDLNFEAIEKAGSPPTCSTCSTEETPKTTFSKINPDEGGECTSTRDLDYYYEFRVCPSSSRNRGEFLYYQITKPYGSQAGLTKKSREIFLHSKENTLNGTFLTFQDVDTNLRAATQMGSDVFLLPRKNVPSVRVDGNELIISLQTGEEVVLDKTTRAIIRGALREGEPAFGSSTQPANVHYSGNGISIRMDLRTYDDPRRKSVNATVVQGSKTCTVSRTRFFSANGIPLTHSDSEFLRAINSACPGRNFVLPE